MQHIRSTLVNIYPRAVQYTYTILPNHGRRLNHRLYRWSELPPLGPCCVTAWRSGWQTIFHYVNGGRLKAASLVLAFRTLLPVSHFYTAQRYTSLSLPHLHYRQSHNNILSPKNGDIPVFVFRMHVEKLQAALSLDVLHYFTNALFRWNRHVHVCMIRQRCYPYDCNFFHFTYFT